MENKFNQFFQKYNNQFVEKIDPSNLYQCFDLAIAWCEFLGLPLSIFSGLLNASQIYTNPTDLTKQNFDFIPNSPTAIPQAGDMPVWSGSLNGGAGHVAIASGKGDTNGFESFDQNWPVASSAHLQAHNYNFVLGWLRFKSAIPPDTSMNKTLADEFRKLTQHNSAYITGEAVLTDLSAKDKAIGDRDQKIADLTNQVATLQTQYTSFQTESASKLAMLSEDCDSRLKAQNATCTAEYSTEINTLLEEIKTLKSTGVSTVYTETPLTDRFKSKSFSDKLKGILDILQA